MAGVNHRHVFMSVVANAFNKIVIQAKPSMAVAVKPLIYQESN